MVYHLDSQYGLREYNRIKLSHKSNPNIPLYQALLSNLMMSSCPGHKVCLAGPVRGRSAVR
ncbi:hypothetical protein BDR07DRAFT_1415453 [Suillus spraguei]|nr:hypothetical protein BDR07DRAFT_1415453 [Suillus spraguei]